VRRVALLGCVLGVLALAGTASAAATRSARACGSGYPLTRPEIFNVRATGLTCLHAVAVIMTAYGSDLRQYPFVGSFRCTFRSDGEAAGRYRCKSGRRVVTADYSVF
jgi:hypothetical protein